MIRTISDDLCVIHRFRDRMELEFQRRRALKLITALFAVIMIGILIFILSPIPTQTYGPGRTLNPPQRTAPARSR